MSNFVLNSMYPSFQYYKIHSEREYFHVLYVYVCSTFASNAVVHETHAKNIRNFTFEF